jgi:signal transduction histidine kinase/CheY-like chemotaxis protein
LIENNQLVVKAFHGPHPPYEVYDLDRGIIGRVARTGEPAFVPDVRQDQDYQACFVESIAELAVPIYREQAVVGVINVESERFEQLTEQDRILLELLAGQISVALENAVLYEHIRLHAEELEHTVERRTSELTALYKLSQEIGYNLSYEELLKLLLHHLHNAIDAELVGGCLIINDSRSFFIETNRPAAPEVLDEIRQMWQSLFLQIGKKPPEFKQIRVKTVPSGDYDENRAPIQEISSRLQAPIYSGREITGLLIAADERQEAFGAEQERLLTTFANQATTALQRLSAILSAQQKHLENLVEHVPVGILLLDADFNLLIANPLGREFLSVINGDDFEGPLTRLGSFPLQELSAHHVEPFPIEISVPGPPRRIFAVQTRRIQESKSQWILTLHEVTRERENQARIQSQERLATVGQLAAGIAHDFNNIMAAILVYADLLHQDPNIQYSSREKLNIIQQQVQRASSLIRQILDFSRRSIMEQSALDLLPFIKELDKLLGRIMPESIRLELTYLPGNYWVNADPTRLQQVFMNLALNARDAMPKGGLLRFDLGRVEVGSTKKAPLPEMSPGDWIRVSISDNGVGIPADVQQYIFDPFFTTKPMGQGTGLGLAQVYGIIKQHGGFIEVSSHSGEGATFIIYLPALPPPKPKTGEFDSGANVFGNEEMVLVVEDNDATREALEALLEARNYRVLTACNGIEALERFEQKDGQISLVISDVVMPQMGGVALYGALRERWNHVPMLFITGHPMEVENQALLETGNVHWLQKPFSVQDLNHAIQELLNGGKRSD